ncbi:MAG: CPBP family intramembrane metalloprotease [Anaerolineae bacterium]|nr:CPBP family intramembrane metalloprotease [Anaerolineae bacterium]MCA9889392.1 CPBP family intramembrane metalloprotease [Anaerolineae bacterium]MCA9892580.1 CPBP family intramembrane metalloprotease [Anaerolineae bacterium]MCB9461882.1 CPBP family intramembrane metalloprotease [Anaerolineaceae bacterium]
MSDRYDPDYSYEPNEDDDSSYYGSSDSEPYADYSSYTEADYNDSPFSNYSMAPVVDEQTSFDEHGQPLLGADALPQEADAPQPLYRGGTGDPAFGLLLAGAVAIGLMPMLPANADLRYTLSWGVLGAVGVMAWLFGNSERIGQERLESLGWGIGFALLVGGPFTVFGWDVLGRAVPLAFPGMAAGTLLAYLVFVMPMGETLFFRGVFQETLDFWVVGIMAGVWNLLLIFPVMWGDIQANPAVGIIFAIGLFAMSMLYSYVRERNGLAAAWICQIALNLIMLFLPVIGR